VRINGLPSDAATFGGWGVQDELAAVQAEFLHAVIVRLLRLGGYQKKVDQLRIPRPEMVSGPKPKKTAKQKVLEIGAILGRKR
jgi:hypothetical protein